MHIYWCNFRKLHIAAKCLRINAYLICSASSLPNKCRALFEMHCSFSFFVCHFADQTLTKRFKGLCIIDYRRSETETPPFKMSFIYLVICLRLYQLINTAYAHLVNRECISSEQSLSVIKRLFFLWQIFWAFSIYLEAVAILPQLVLLQRSGNVDNLTVQYVFFLGYANCLQDFLSSQNGKLTRNLGLRNPWQIYGSFIFDVLGCFLRLCIFIVAGSSGN